MTFDIKVHYEWGKTAVAREGGENGEWPSSDVSVVLPRDLQQWASRFGTEECLEVCMFLKHQNGGASLSFAACPEVAVNSIAEAEKQPGGALTFVLDLPTLTELHAAIGLAIANTVPVKSLLNS
jgi:hypothetical protein